MADTEHWKRLVRNGHQPDFVILCGSNLGWRFEVHRDIIKRGWPFLEAATEPMYGFKEAHEGVLRLEDDDPAAVAALLLWLYDNIYRCTSQDLNWCLIFHVRVYALAEKYLLAHLQQVVGRMLRELFREIYIEGLLLPSYKLRALAHLEERVPENDVWRRFLVARWSLLRALQV